jgi:trehalose 6-phosphate synthase
MLPRPIALELLDGLLGADLLGFYAARWVEYFLQTCSDTGYHVDQQTGSVRARDGRWVPVQAYPLGVDPQELRREVTCPDALRHRRALAELASGRRLIVRVERMDPVKNLLRGLNAFACFLEQHHWARNQVVHFVLACASRRAMPAYQRYRADVVARVREINRRFGRSTWQPVVLVEEQDYLLGLVALALADAVVINSIRDGMNIVAKEAAAVSDRDAVLILSRTAGAADEMADGALMVDPLCTSELADAIGAALEMPVGERQRRAALLRQRAAALPPRAWLAAQRQDLAQIVKESAHP